jgi:hypothetical protein
MSAVEPGNAVSLSWTACLKGVWIVLQKRRAGHQRRRESRFHWIRGWRQAFTEKAFKSGKVRRRQSPRNVVGLVQVDRWQQQVSLGVRHLRTSVHEE